MTFSVTALTPTRLIDVRSTSLAEVRNTIAEAKSEGALTINLEKDGRSISEFDLARLLSAIAIGSTVTKFA